MIPNTTIFNTTIFKTMSTTILELLMEMMTKKEIKENKLNKVVKRKG